MKEESIHLYKLLDELNIKYEEMEHKAVFTVEEVKQIKEKINGTGCKNLFLTDKKGNYYLVILHEDKRADIKKIASFVNKSHLSFANETDLKEILNLERGSCTPFGIIYDTKNKVIILIDQELKEQKLLFHPNRNTATISIDFRDLIRFVEFENHQYKLI